MTRSLRPRKARLLPTVNDASDSGEESASKPFHKPVKWKTNENKDDDHKGLSKTSARGKIPRGRVGKLAQLPHMPLEILFEIFTSLPPLDLLRLTRTSKTLRGLLMSRSSRPTWVAVLATVPDCPPVPEGMAEPAWVYLAFENTCHKCEAKNVKSVLWAARIRLCANCFNKESNIIGYELDNFGYVSKEMVTWDNVLGKSRYRRFARQDELQAVQATLKTWPVGSTEREAFIAKCKENSRKRQKHVGECETWAYKRIDQHVADLEAARQRRQEAIESRLADMDPEYAKDFAWLRSLTYDLRQYKGKFEQLKSVRQTKSLTDRIWMNCKPEVVAFMKPVRPLRQANDWLEVLKRRATLLSSLLVERCPSHVIAPCVMDLYSRLDVRSILERPLDDDGRDTVDEFCFTGILADFDAVLAYVRAERTNTMLVALRAKSDTPDAVTEADLDRPTSLFRCTAADRDCTSGVMNSVTALIHRCERHLFYTIQSRGTSLTELQLMDPLERMRFVCAQVRVSGGQADIELDPRAIVRVEQFMTLLDVDPVEVTMAYLDELDPWFSCSCPYCTTPGNQGSHSTKSVTDWRHLVSQHHYNATHELGVLDEDERALAIKERDACKSSLNPASASTVAVWACGHCLMSPLTANALEQHVRNTHQVQGDLQLDIDYRASRHCFASLSDGHVIRSLQPNLVVEAIAGPSDA